MRSSTELLKPNQFTFSLDDIFVIPPDLFRLFEPAFDIGLFDLIGLRVDDGRVFEFPRSRLQLVFVETGSTPKHEPDASLELAVTYSWVAFKKPDWMAMPDFRLRLG